MSVSNRYKQYLLNLLKLISIEVGAILLAFIFSLLVVILIVRRIILLKTEWFDERVFSFLKNQVSDNATAFMNGITILGSHYFLIPAFLILILHSFFIKKDKWLGIKIAAISITSVLLMLFLKNIFNRPRPLIPLLSEAGGLSFPSGHAFMSFSFFGLLIYIIYKEIKSAWKYLLIILIACIVLLIGLSRIYLRVHYASDVIAGLCMGFMWIVISLTVIHFMEKQKSNLPAV